MIREIEVENVRLFEGEGWQLTFPLLSVVCGTNSAGKSTLLKAPLVLRQTQGIGESYEATRGRLRLAGSQVDLGSYQSFVSHNDIQRDVSIGLTIADTVEESAIQRVRWLATRKGKDVFIPPVRETGTVPYTLKTRFRFGLVPGRARGGGPSGSASTNRPLLKLGQFELIVDDRTVLDWQVSPIPNPEDEHDQDMRYRLLLPVNYFRFAGGLERMDVPIREGDKYVALETILRGFLPQGILARVKRGERSLKSAKRKREFSIWPLPYLVSGALDDFQKALTEIHYLGPLRSAAERYYVARSATYPGMDQTGEFLPYVLRDRGNTPVMHCVPATETPVSEPLSRALDTWLSYLRTGQVLRRGATKHEIALETTKEVLVEVSIRSLTGTESHALADSGFGYSQVLPVLMKGLLAQEGSTLIVEQPELHLNPALQVRLAEFFVAMARCGKQILLETHSEHILNAMRVLSAESEQPSFDCAVYFVDVDSGRPKIHSLSVSEDGTVVGWPPHFFGEATTLTARLLRAQKKFLTLKTGGK